MPAAARREERYVFSGQIVERLQSFLGLIKAEGGQRRAYFFRRRRGGEQQFHFARYGRIFFEGNIEQSAHGLPRVVQMPLQLCDKRRCVVLTQKPRGNLPNYS